MTGLTILLVTNAAWNIFLKIEMLKYLLIFVSTYLLVSSAVLHAKKSPKNVAFEVLGNYSAK